jgi:flavin-dependent dehydrogenase
LLPLRVIGKTYGPRLLVVGDAGGFTKPTTGGGIFYSLLTASLAAETLIEGFRRGRLDEAFLSRYEARWRERLGKELKLAGWFRHVVTRLTDAEIDVLVRAVVSDDVQALIRSAARFNWHRDLILALVRQRGLARVLFGALFR